MNIIALLIGLVVAIGGLWLLVWGGKRVLSNA